MKIKIVTKNSKTTNEIISMLWGKATITKNKTTTEFVFDNQFYNIWFELFSNTLDIKEISFVRK